MLRRIPDQLVLGRERITHLFKILALCAFASMQIYRRIIGDINLDTCLFQILLVAVPSGLACILMWKRILMRFSLLCTQALIEFGVFCVLAGSAETQLGATTAVVVYFLFFVFQIGVADPSWIVLTGHVVGTGVILFIGNWHKDSKPAELLGRAGILAVAGFFIGLFIKTLRNKEKEIAKAYVHEIEVEMTAVHRDLLVPDDTHTWGRYSCVKIAQPSRGAVGGDFVFSKSDAQTRLLAIGDLSGHGLAMSSTLAGTGLVFDAAGGNPRRFIHHLHRALQTVAIVHGGSCTAAALRLHESGYVDVYGYLPRLVHVPFKAHFAEVPLVPMVLGKGLLKMERMTRVVLQDRDMLILATDGWLNRNEEDDRTLVILTFHAPKKELTTKTL